MYVFRNLILFATICLFTLNSYPIFASNVQNSFDLLYEGKIVDSIVIDNRNIYDTDQKEYNKFVFKLANKIHIKTQKRVIKRELLIQKNKPFSEKLAEETTRILRQRFVIYDAWIEKEIYDNDKLLIRIVTIDQWSLTTGVDVRFEGNENRIKIGALEKNLFGQNRRISFYYINQSEDDNYTEASYRENRLFGEKLIGQISMGTNPLNKFVRVALQNPYYDLNQQFGFFLVTKFKKGRIDYYVNDLITSQSFFEGNRTDAEVFYRVGSYQTKYLARLSYIYNYEKSNSNQLIPDLAEDSLFHAFSIGVDYSHFDYQKFYNIDGFNFTEDFNKGFQVRFDYQIAYSPYAQRSIYNFSVASLRKNLIIKNSLITLQIVHQNWSHSSQNIRRRNTFNAKFYNQTIENITLAVNAEYRSDASTKAFDLVSLGGTSGIRGTDKFFLTGDKKYVLNTEIRLLPQLLLFSFNFGGVVFSDIANIARSGDTFKLSDSYVSFGTGLRIAFDKSSRNIMRIDFAYSRVKGWQLSFGSGQYFNASPSI